MRATWRHSRDVATWAGCTALIAGALVPVLLGRPRRLDPIDLAVYETDSLKLKLQKRIEESDPYFRMVHTQWGEGLRRVFAELPNPDWT